MAGLSWNDFPAICLALSTLVLLEGLLSADNALVLAVMVRHLPKYEQKKALRYGIWGAFIFRAIAVVFAYQLSQFWQLKLLGGLYLFYLAAKHFILGEGEADGAEGSGGPRKHFGDGFWATVISVELADIAFSIDSILAAVAMVEGLPEQLQQNKTIALTIIYIGGVLGIIMMRLVAGIFLVLLNRYKGLESGAYLLVAWIGLKLIGSGLHSGLNPVAHPFPKSLAGQAEQAAASAGSWRDSVPAWIRDFTWEMPDWFFWAGMAVIVIGSLAYRPRAGEKHHGRVDKKDDSQGDGTDQGQTA